MDFSICRFLAPIIGALDFFQSIYKWDFFLEVNILADISKEQVKHVANLARLALTDEEVEKMTKQLGDIINYAELLNELDTENVKPTTHVLDLKKRDA